MYFRDRADAGRLLAGALGRWEGSDAVVVGIPRRGILVAAEVARRLDLALTCAPVEQIPFADNPELSMGAVSLDGRPLWDDAVLELLEAWDQAYLDEPRRVAARLQHLRAQMGAANPDELIGGRDVLVVDDRVRTGQRARAVLAYARRHGARSVVLAVPCISVASRVWVGVLADSVIALIWSSEASLVRQCYRNLDGAREPGDAELAALFASCSRQRTPTQNERVTSP